MKSIFLITKYPRPILLLCLLALFSISIQAQASRAVFIQRRIDTLNRQATEFERENMNREKNGETKVVDSKRARQIRAEIETDLIGIQTAYNDIVIAVQSRGAMPADFIAASASGIKKHALRLRTNLALPKGKDDKETPIVEIAAKPARESMTALCGRIYAFITNPIFESTTGLDVKHAAKARLDLDGIIELSGKLSESETSKK